MRISDCIRINNCQNLKIIATMLSCYNDGTRDRYQSLVNLMRAALVAVLQFSIH